MWTLLSVTDNYITKPPFQSHCKTNGVPPPPRRSPQWVRASSLSKLHDHTQTHHAQQDSSGPVISPLQRPLHDNTRHSQETNIHAPGVIRTCNPSKQAVADPCLRLGSEQVTLQHAIFLAIRKILLVRHLQQTHTHNCLFPPSTPVFGKELRKDNFTCVLLKWEYHKGDVALQPRRKNSVMQNGSFFFFLLSLKAPLLQSPSAWNFSAAL